MITFGNRGFTLTCNCTECIPKIRMSKSYERIIIIINYNNYNKQLKYLVFRYIQFSQVSKSSEGLPREKSDRVICKRSAMHKKAVR